MLLINLKSLPGFGRSILTKTPKFLLFGIIFLNSTTMK